MAHQKLGRATITQALTQMGTAQKHFADLQAQMTQTQRENFFAQYPKEDFSKDEIVQPQVRAVQVPHLPVRVTTSQPPRAQSVIDNQKMERDRIEIETLRTAFGGQIPGIP